MRRPGAEPLPAHHLGRGVRAAWPASCGPCPTPTRRCSTPRAAPATRRRSCTSCSCGSSAPTTCPTARTCATSRAAWPCARRWAWARGRSSWTTSTQADAIFILGQNPGTNHPRMLTTLQQAARRGCRIVSINPLAEAALSRFRHPQNPLEMLGRGTPIACLHLPVRIGGDIALLKGIARRCWSRKARQPGTVRRPRRSSTAHTEGFAAFADRPGRRALDGAGRGERHRPGAHASRPPRSPPRSRRLIACWAMGLTQHRHAVANIQEVVNLLLLGGHLGRPGAGACPVRGHSNVQGDRTMGIFEHVDGPFLDRLEAALRLPAAAPARAWTRWRPSPRSRPGARACSSPWAATSCRPPPTPSAPPPRLTRCRLTAHVSTKLNRSPPGHRPAGADPALPGPQRARPAGRRRAVRHRRGLDEPGAPVAGALLDPASPQLRSEPAIVAGLAAGRAGPRAAASPGTALAADYDRIRDHIAAVIPGFEDFNAPRARRTRRLRAAQRRPRAPLPHRQRPRPLHRAPHAPAPRWQPGELVMMTIRSHDQFNTTIYGLDDRYRGIHGGRRVVLVHRRRHRRARASSPGEVVDLDSHFQGEIRRARRFVVVAYAIPRGCAATYFPEANALVPLDVAGRQEPHPDLEVGGDHLADGPPIEAAHLQDEPRQPFDLLVGQLALEAGHLGPLAVQHARAPRTRWSGGRSPCCRAGAGWGRAPPPGRRCRGRRRSSCPRTAPCPARPAPAARPPPRSGCRRTPPAPPARRRCPRPASSAPAAASWPRRRSAARRDPSGTTAARPASCSRGSRAPRPRPRRAGCGR